MKRTVIDGHFHLSLTRTMSRLENVEDTLAVLNGCGLQAICVQNIVLWFPEHLTRNPLSLLAKLREPERVFSFGGIRFPPPDSRSKEYDYLRQAEELIALGFDGIKLFGKPNMRRQFGEPFDSQVFDAMFAWLEERQIPVLFHVGDPREFWDASTAPQFARDNGWIYTEPPFDAYYEEIGRLMKKFPRLRVLFPHFFFLSDDLERLGAFLHQWKSAWIDITPGSEMYHNFSLYPEKARAFFLEFQDRILFGTDNTGAAEGEARDCVGCAGERMNTMLDVLAGETAAGWGETFCGLSLPRETVDQIAYQNFYRFVGRLRPRSVDATQAAAYARRMREQALGACNPGLQKEFDRILGAYEQWLQTN